MTFSAGRAKLRITLPRHSQNSTTVFSLHATRFGASQSPADDGGRENPTRPCRFALPPEVSAELNGVCRGRSTGGRTAMPHGQKEAATQGSVLPDKKRGVSPPPRHQCRDVRQLRVGFTCPLSGAVQVAKFQPGANHQAEKSPPPQDQPNVSAFLGQKCTTCPKFLVVSVEEKNLILWGMSCPPPPQGQSGPHLQFRRGGGPVHRWGSVHHDGAGRGGKHLLIPETVSNVRALLCFFCSIGSGGGVVRPSFGRGWNRESGLAVGADRGGTQSLMPQIDQAIQAMEGLR